MTESSVSTASTSEMSSARRRFHLASPPSGAPFVSGESAAVVETGDHLAIEYLQPEPASQASARATKILDDIINRSRREVAKYPTSARALSNLGLALLNKGDLAEAASHFSEALSYESANYVALVNLARIYISQGDIDAAEDLYKRISRTREDDVSALLGLAHIERQREHFDTAMQLFQRVVKAAPTSVVARYQLGLLYLSKRDTRNALLHLKAAARIDVRSPALHHAVGIAYSMTGDRKRAVRAFQAALSLEPSRTDSVHALSYVLLQDNKPDPVIDLLREQLNEKDDVETRHLLAIAYYQCGRPEAARVQLRKGLGQVRSENGETKARFLNNLGLCDLKMGNAREAEEAFISAIRTDPSGSTIPYHNLAGFYVNHNSLGDAFSVLELCAERFPNDAETVWQSALVMADQGVPAAAMARLRGFINSKPDMASPEVYATLSGLLADEEGSLDEAMAELLRARTRFPSNVVLANNLAYVHLLKGQADPARAILESVPFNKVPEPTRVIWTATRGLLKIVEGQLEGGIALYREAAQMASKAGRTRLANQVRQKMHLELARAFQRAGNLKRALTEARAGLSEEGKPAYRHALLEMKRALEQTQPQ